MFLALDYTDAPLYNTTSNCNMHCDDYSMSVSVCKNGRYYCTVFRHVFGQIPLASFGCVSFNADKVNTIITGLATVLKETAGQPPHATVTPFVLPLWHHMASMVKCSPSARKMSLDVLLEFWLPVCSGNAKLLERNVSGWLRPSATLFGRICISNTNFFGSERVTAKEWTSKELSFLGVQ